MRLIDADELIDVFERAFIDCCSMDLDCDTCHLPGVNCELGEMKLIIKDMPTYDIDKVVEELELHSFEFGTDKLPSHYVRLNKAIEIVKAGGKNETDNT